MVAMCRNDGKLLRYELEVDLYGEVRPFEIEQSLLQEYQNEVKDYENAYSVYLELNKTYYEDLESFDAK